METNNLRDRMNRMARALGVDVTELDQARRVAGLQMSEQPAPVRKPKQMYGIIAVFPGTPRTPETPPTLPKEIER